MFRLERETRVELATPAALRAILCLGSRCSTTELLSMSKSTSRGMPAFSNGGLPDPPRRRLRTAYGPRSRTPPADLRKEGRALRDTGIALHTAILAP